MDLTDMRMRKVILKSESPLMRSHYLFVKVPQKGQKIKERLGLQFPL